MRSLWFALVLVVAIPCFAAQPKAGAKPHKTPAKSATMPVTCSSPAARKVFEQGMVDLENIQLDRMVDEWRESVKKDPNFALGWLFVSYGTKDPAEESAARAKAKALARRVTPPERLLIAWLTGIRENDFVPAIKAMNDLLAEYPRDKRLNFLAGRFLTRRDEYEAGQKYFERALEIDPNYAAGHNELGYAYAYAREYDKAIAEMDKYTQMLPNEPNPQDSYAEILRMAGKFDQALVHYQKALQVDPKFTSSQLGIADTYALMGDEPRARDEYKKAIELADNKADKAAYAIQSAATYVREKDYPSASKALTIAAAEAEQNGLAIQAAEAYRTMAMYEPEASAAIEDLGKAEASLAHAQDISQSDRDEEMAHILRLQVARAAEGGRKDESAQALQKLSDLAKSSSSTLVQRDHEAAQGVLLMRDAKYAEAVPHLEEDINDAVSARRLLTCYEKTGAAEQAKDLSTRLAALNVPTIEQAMVVPAFRAELASSSEPKRQ